MERNALDSSSIAEIGYEPMTQTLEVVFHNGGIYQYFGVPLSDYDALMAAESKGRFLNDNIKTRYRYVRLA